MNLTSICNPGSTKQQRTDFQTGVDTNDDEEAMCETSFIS